jgi:heme exporter protein C
MTAPILIARARYESTMGLVQKIFYFHMPPAMLMLLSAIFCGIVSAVFLVRKRPFYDWMAVRRGRVDGALRRDGDGHRPAVGREKAWGVWWVWDARLTMSLLMWMVFVSYLLLRRYGGPGSETLAAGLALSRHGDRRRLCICRSISGGRFTLSPRSSRHSRSISRLRCGTRSPAFLLMYIALMMLRMTIERQRAMLDQLYLESEE